MKRPKILERVRGGSSGDGIDLEALGPRPRIVVVVRDHMSGVLYSIPALRALRHRWPDAEITLLASNYATPVLAGGCPYADRILPLYTFSDDCPRFARVKDATRKLRTWQKLVGRVDLVVHLRWVGDSTVAFCASLGLPLQAGYQQGRLDSLLSLNLGLPDTSLGSRERNQIIIERLGIEPVGDHMEIWIADADREWAQAWLAAQGHDDETFVTMVHPGSHWGCNQWLVDRWSDTASRVLHERGGSVIVTGNSRERPLAEQIAANIDGPAFVAAGETTQIGRASCRERV